MTKIFVGSSTAAKCQATALMKGCARSDVVFLPWWSEFRAGRTLLEELTRIRKHAHRAILILSPEFKIEIRGSAHAIPNLNVLFEFGFFYGALGPHNVAVVRYGEIHLPSDLGGYIHITGSKHFTPRRAVSVGKRTKNEFTRWLHPFRRNDEAAEKPTTSVPRQYKFRSHENFVTGWRRW
jgi:predicted nucleotide-binding protein